jgi:serine protease AprX
MRIALTIIIIFLANAALSANSGQRFWVYFKDKGSIGLHKISSITQLPLSYRAIQRRMNQGISPLYDYADLPLEPAYLQQLRERGFIIHQQSKWFNAVSVIATAAEIDKLYQLPFVQKIEKVCSYHFIDQDRTAGSGQVPLPKVQQDEYGPSENQNKMIGVPPAHQMGFHGEGVRIALFDTGFLLQHEALQQVQVMASWDFVQGDSIVSNEGTDVSSQHNHGTEILAIIAGYKPGSLIGPAYAAEYLLAKTEVVSSETHLEEDNWVAAAEWADSLGADIISTSLGYSTFDSGQVDYTYADMNGNTTIITRAADLAASKGIAVFASAGNEGSNAWHYITAPADGDSVIAVGGVRADSSHWSISSYGPSADGRIKPDLMAQGQSVYSISPILTNQYISVSGTSAACPLAAGAAAILLSVDSTITVMQLYELLKSTASQAQNPDNTMGYGLINLEKSIALKLDGKIVQLSDFTSCADQGRNVLNWTVESMLGIRQWIIERQTGSAGFREIGRLEMPVEEVYPANLSFVDVDISGGEFCRYRLQVELMAGNVFILDTLAVQSTLPSQTGLYQNFPNPFNSATQIIFSLDQPQEASLFIYDGNGRLLRTLVDNFRLPAAFHHYIWDGTTAKGSMAASGVYYIVLSAGSVRKVIKSVFLK